jgi:hypothetical protein
LSTTAEAIQTSMRLPDCFVEPGARSRGLVGSQ